MRRFILFALAAACLFAAPSPPALAQSGGSKPQTQAQSGDTYAESEIVNAVAGFFGITAKEAAKVVAKVFEDQGRPNAYIKGEEGSGAVGVGLRYGKGVLQMKSGARRTVYWQGPSVGFDAGGNASKVFTLVYNLPSTDAIYRRFPGVEGSAYYVAGIGVNYQRAENITLAPMRAGVGLRLGANIGYLSYSKKRKVSPF